MTEPEKALQLHDGRQLPATPDLRRQLRDGIDAVLTAELAAAGAIETDADAAPLVRRFAAMHEVLKDYGRAFTDSAKTVESVLKEHALIATQGEQDGVPNGSISVPDTDGSKITVRPDLINKHAFDIDALISGVVVANIETDEAKARLFEVFQAEFSGDGDRSRELLAALLSSVVHDFLELGKFEPQVTKVKKLTDELGRAAMDKVAATIDDAHTKTVAERGLKVERTYPKEKP
jgi:hypothetical protein